MYLHPAHHAPDYMRDTFIHRGYRVNYSWKMCMKSIFKAHNETVNVWTHFIGFLIFAGLMIHIIFYVKADDTMPAFPTSNITLQHTFLENAHKLYSEGIPPNVHSQRISYTHSYPYPCCPAHNHNLTSPLPPLFPSYPTTAHHHNAMQDEGLRLAAKNKIEEVKQFLTQCRNGMEKKMHELDIYFKEFEKSVQEFSDNSDASVALLSERLGEMQEVFNEKIAKYFSPKSKLPIMVFLVSAMICFLGSALYHTFGCQSHWHSSFFLKIDYSGISTLIAGSIVPFVWYTFDKLTHWQFFYLGTLSILSCLVMYVSFAERFSSHEAAPFRVLCFVLLAAFAIVPFLHVLYLHGTIELYAFQRCAISAALYLLGVIAYLSRVPERLFPGRCDFLLQSHQVFHTFIVAAALVWYSFALRLLVSKTYVN